MHRDVALKRHTCPSPSCMQEAQALQLLQQLLVAYCSPATEDHPRVRKQLARFFEVCRRMLWLMMPIWEHHGIAIHWSAYLNLRADAGLDNVYLVAGLRSWWSC